MHITSKYFISYYSVTIYHKKRNKVLIMKNEYREKVKFTGYAESKRSNVNQRVKRKQNIKLKW